MTNYKMARAIIKSVKRRFKDNKSIAYAITSKNFWMDYPNERTIRLFSLKDNGYNLVVNKNIGNFIFN